MTTRALTERERDILHHRISRAVAWSDADQYKRDAANRVASAIVDELDKSGFSAATQRRAVQNIVARIEERQSA